ncbi:polymer-forming cytoskeletal protein [Paenibacillus pinistramenti]|uniref:polymer-forming cytoskeletal protein n=1 Tax=Paenibacillus pinistramenti TaxID=1768003 RepID=UPI001107A945|nr:polymer-forming cytoskeletal protein [Paenibacillus pinistramenti]
MSEQGQHTGNEPVRNDLNISGMSTTAGGIYRNVRIDGMAKVNGSLDCSSLRINGTLNMKGSVATGEMTVNGMGTIEGPVKASEIRIDGMFTLRGDVSCTNLDVNGKSKIEGRLEGDQIRIGGEVGVKGDVQCEAFYTEGNVKLEGLLNAESVEIRLHSVSAIREIGCERIDVRRIERGFWKNFSLMGAPRLKADLIEGDDLYLEDTEAETVRGTRVYIGRGCKIKRVEYKESLQTDEDAVIGTPLQV